MRLRASLEKKELALLRAESVVKRRLPVNLAQGDLPLFSEEMERVIPQTRLLEIRNVWVSADGILFKGGRILPESFAFPANFEKWKTRSVYKFLARNYLIRKRRVFEETALWIVDDWSRGYFHWLADALTRLFTIRDRVKDSVLLLPHSYKGLEFVAPSLKPFGVERVEYIGANEVLFCPKLIMPTHTAPSGNYDEQTIRGVRDLLLGLNSDKPRGSPYERVYLSRGKAPKRKVSNEEEVVRVLKEFEFRIIYSEDYPFEAEVMMASGVRHLISNHGAGLTNMLFMKPGSNVLELRNSTERSRNAYFALASALQLNYFYQTCEPETFGEDQHTANLIVDVRTLRENLSLMLGG